jgi:hypothetical protein
MKMSNSLYHYIATLLVVINTDADLYDQWKQTGYLGPSIGLFDEDEPADPKKLREEVKMFLQVANIVIIDVARKKIGAEKCSLGQITEWIRCNFPALAQCAPEIQSLLLVSLFTNYIH